MHSLVLLEYELVIFWKNIILCSCMHIIMHTTTLEYYYSCVVLLLLQYYYYSSSTLE